LLAKTDPAYLGYDIERYMRMDWNAKNIPGKYRAAAMTGAILRYP
jgi:hypothetical protein